MRPVFDAAVAYCGDLRSRPKLDALRVAVEDATQPMTKEGVMTNEGGRVGYDPTTASPEELQARERMAEQTTRHALVGGCIGCPFRGPFCRDVQRCNLDPSLDTTDTRAPAGCPLRSKIHRVFVEWGDNGVGWDPESDLPNWDLHEVTDDPKLEAAKDDGMLEQARWTIDAQGCFNCPFHNHDTYESSCNLTGKAFTTDEPDEDGRVSWCPLRQQAACSCVMCRPNRITVQWSDDDPCPQTLRQFQRAREQGLGSHVHRKIEESAKAAQGGHDFSGPKEQCGIGLWVETCTRCGLNAMLCQASKIECSGKPTTTQDAVRHAYERDKEGKLEATKELPARKMLVIDDLMEKQGEALRRELLRDIARTRYEELMEDKQLIKRAVDAGVDVSDEQVSEALSEMACEQAEALVDVMVKRGWL